MKTVLLAGGGHGHVTYLKQLMGKKLVDTRILLISESAKQYYSGMLPGFIQGQYTEEDFSFDLPKLCQAVGATFVEATIDTIDHSQKQVITSKGSFAYDLLSINLGSTSHHEFLTFEKADVVASKPLGPLVEFTKKLPVSPIHLVLIGGGVSGAELAMAYALRLPNSRITLVHRRCHIAENLGIQVERLLLKRMKRLGIRICSNTEVLGLQDHKLETQKGPISFDYAILTSGYQGPSVKFIGLDTSDAGFVRVNHLLEATPGVYAMGDCCQIIGQEWVPKAGVYAIRQAPILAKNLMADILGKGAKEGYLADPSPLQIINIGEDLAIYRHGKRVFQGRLAFGIKDYIDLKYMGEY